MRNASDLTLDALGTPNLGNTQVIRSLKVQPGASVAAKISGQSHRGRRCMQLRSFIAPVNANTPDSDVGAPLQ